jgi:hypothetical protein
LVQRPQLIPLLPHAHHHDVLQINAQRRCRRRIKTVLPLMIQYHNRPTFRCGLTSKN